MSDVHTMSRGNFWEGEWTGWQSNRHFLDGQRPIEAEIQASAAAETGMHLLGYLRRSTSDRMGSPIVWRREGVGSLGDLPPALVEGARVAAQAFDQTAGALADARWKAAQWQEQHPTASEQLVRVKTEEIIIEPKTAHDKAAEALTVLAVELATTRGRIDQARAVLAGGSSRVETVRAQARADIERIEGELLEARQTLADLGI